MVIFHSYVKLPEGMFGAGFLQTRHLETKGLKMSEGLARYCGHDWIHFSSSLFLNLKEGSMAHMVFSYYIILHNPKLLDINMGMQNMGFSMKH